MGNSYVKYRDNSEDVIRLFHKAKHRGLEAIGLTAETYAKKELSKPKPHANGISRPNVDTGLLRNSITYAVSGYAPHVKEYRRSNRNPGDEDAGKKHTYTSYNGIMDGEKDEAVYIGTNVEYAPHVEYGTSRAKAYPFLRPAATEHGEEYRKLMEDSMKNA